jgi:hypothetical protein
MYEPQYAGEISFYDPGFADLIGSGTKLGTLRADNDDRNKYPFERGALALAKCQEDGVDLPIRVLEVQRRSLKDLSIPLLMLDGFPSHKAAADRMGDFYPNVSMDSPMAYVAFTHEAMWQAMPPWMQEPLLNWPIDEAMKDPDLRPVFLPSLCQWFIWDVQKRARTLRRGDPADQVSAASEWFEFLEHHGLISQAEGDAVSELNFENTEDGSLPLLDFVFNPHQIQALLDTPRGERGDLYDVVVLARTEIF